MRASCQPSAFSDQLLICRRDPPRRIKEMYFGCVEGTARRAPTKRDSGSRVVARDDNPEPRNSCLNAEMRKLTLRHEYALTYP